MYTHVHTYRYIHMYYCVAGRAINSHTLYRRQVGPLRPTQMPIGLSLLSIIFLWVPHKLAEGAASASEAMLADKNVDAGQ